MFQKVSKVWEKREPGQIPFHHEDDEAYHEEQTRIIKLAQARNFPT